jgi:regulator of protease activity HflC (stomatin/prohibitin superfamily)
VGGISYEERQPGLTFQVPFVNRAHRVDVREQRFATVSDEGKANAVVHTTDLQEVFVRASLIWRISPDLAAEVLDDIGSVDQVLPIIRALFYDAIKEAGGQAEALSLAENLGPLAAQVDTIIRPQLEAKGIEILEVAIEDAVFDEAFLLSIKEKVIADQEAEEQRRLVEAEAAKKQQVEIQAAAQQARAAQLGLSPQEYLDLLWLEKWNGTLPTTVLGSEADVILDGLP